MQTIALRKNAHYRTRAPSSFQTERQSHKDSSRFTFKATRVIVDKTNDTKSMIINGKTPICAQHLQSTFGIILRTNTIPHCAPSSSPSSPSSSSSSSCSPLLPNLKTSSPTDKYRHQNWPKGFCYQRPTVLQLKLCWTISQPPAQFAPIPWTDQRRLSR